MYAHRLFLDFNTFVTYLLVKLQSSDVLVMMHTKQSEPPCCSDGCMKEIKKYMTEKFEKFTDLDSCDKAGILNEVNNVL
jgi:hypothetical protein